jgi:hypothetical protein
MQFVPDGPDVPLAVLQSQEEGHLALFCGAGVSVPAGLPLFGALVDDVFLAIRAVPTELEARESQAKNYDRVLNLLEARVGPAVRRAVLARLNTPAGVVSEVHASLVTLASDEGGHVRLVTTNYDRLFESSRPDVTWAAAPKLPVPKPARWSDVVHVHGILDPRDAEGQNIVLTSADFGRAYLVEQWASRFVSELFNHFDVLFIGYSVTDAVLRYLVDAIAAERRGDGRIHRAFALAPVEGPAGDSMAEWRARGIEPILYDPREGHRALYDTLAAWSRMRSEGLQSKVNIVQQFGPMDPAGLPPEAISQMCWAVRDVGAAKALARLRERSSIRWLQEFEAAGVFGEAKEDALRSGGGRELERLSGFQAALIPWIASHVKNPDLAEWAVKKRGRLHAALEWAVRKGAQGEAVPAPFASLWYALTGSIRVEDGASFRLDILEAVGSETWSPRLRQEVLEALSPCIEIRPPWRLGARQTPPTTADLVAAECELVAGQFTGLMLERLQHRDDWPSVLLDLSLDLVQRLRQALDYLAVVGHASEDRDPSYFQHPSIEPHAQNRHHSSWTRLIELVREATVVAGARDPRHAGALAARGETP